MSPALIANKLLEDDDVGPEDLHRLSDPRMTRDQFEAALARHGFTMDWWDYAGHKDRYGRDMTMVSIYTFEPSADEAHHKLAQLLAEIGVWQGKPIRTRFEGGEARLIERVLGYYRQAWIFKLFFPRDMLDPPREWK